LRLKRLAALPIVLLLAGCPNLLGSSGNTDLNLKVLAVTQDTGAGATANAYLEWQPITNASQYQVFRTSGESPTSLQKNDKTTFTEPVGVGKTVSYKIVALDSAGNEKIASSPLTVAVLDAEVGAPTHATADTQPVALGGSGITAITAGQPMIKWGAVEKANHYYIRVYDGEDKTIYAALTKEPEAKVGTLVYSDLKVPNFPQVKDQAISAGKVAYLTISAIRANDADIKAATAFDIKASSVGKLFRE
jgi:fibronectin type 3 domain-containing protein